MQATWMSISRWQESTMENNPKKFESVCVYTHIHLCVCVHLKQSAIHLKHYKSTIHFNLIKSSIKKTAIFWRKNKLSIALHRGKRTYTLRTGLKPYWKAIWYTLIKLKIFIFYPITPKRNEAIDNTLMEKRFYLLTEIKIVFTHLY